MGESTCLMQPFSYVSGIPNDEGNPIQALGNSISFGRYMVDSESLAWEKWSTFSHNRYVEEAERYSRPGSVAQKKAFFEAHYKKVAAQRAAALLEQANANANSAAAAATSENAPERKRETRELKKAVSAFAVLVPEQEEEREKKKEEEEEVKKPKVEDEDTSKMDKLEGSKVEVSESVVKHESQAMVENFAEVEIYHKELNDMKLRTPQIEKPLLKESYSSIQEDSTPVKKKKTRLFTSSKSSLAYHKAPKVPSSPAKPTASSFSRKDDAITPFRKNPATESDDKKRSTPKSFHKTVSFTPIRDLSRLTSTVMRKIEHSRVGASSSKASSKDCFTPLRTPTTASKNEVRKRPTTTPCSEKRRAKTPLDPSASGTKTPMSKWRLLRTENKARSPFSSAPFSLRTEERAASRKKKLEEKFNANEAQKVQVQRKLKEKEETEIGKLRQTLCFKARPLPDFYKERRLPPNDNQKVQVTHPQPQKLGKKPTLTPSTVEGSTFHPQSQKLGKKPTPMPTTVEDSSSRPPSRSSIKSSGTKNAHGKNKRTPTCSLILQLKAAHENRSPNIQPV